MDTSTDLLRRVEQLRRGAPTRATLSAMARREQPAPPASAADCLKAARDPDRRLEPLRRQRSQA